MKASQIGALAADEGLKQRVAIRAQTDRLKYQNIWSMAKHLEAEAMRVALTELYTGEAYPPSYRKKFISVKVAGNVRNRRDLKEMEAHWEKRGIIKLKTSQGIIYRIM